MTTGADFRRLALALEGTTEAPHFDRAAFRVARIYATLAADSLTANLKLEPGEQALKCLLAPTAFAPVNNAWGRQGWTTVILAELSDTELGTVLEMAWSHARPKAAKPRPKSSRPRSKASS